MVGRAGTGVDNIDVGAATQTKTLVMNTPRTLWVSFWMFTFLSAFTQLHHNPTKFHKSEICLWIIGDWESIKNMLSSILITWSLNVKIIVLRLIQRSYISFYVLYHHHSEKDDKTSHRLSYQMKVFHSFINYRSEFPFCGRVDVCPDRLAAPICASGCSHHEGRQMGEEGLHGGRGAK